MNEAIIICVTANLSLATLAQERRGNGEARMHRFSATVEKEHPQLNEETKRLIALCRRDPTEENLAALRRQVAANYDAFAAQTPEPDEAGFVPRSRGRLEYETLLISTQEENRGRARLRFP